MMHFQLFETSAKSDSECDHLESIFMTLALKLRDSKPLMSASVGCPDISDALRDIHAAETTAALRESGLVDITSGNTQQESSYQDDAGCC